MSDFSKSPLDMLIENQKKGYVGIHIEQGVPILDRDLNLLNDLITATVRSVVSRYIGNGISAGADGFEIQALPAGQNSQDFNILTSDSGVGSCLVNGLEVKIDAPTTYKSQNDDLLTTPSNTQPDPRTDIIFLDVFLVEVDGNEDDALKNSLDVGMQTSVRLKPGWKVRVAEGVPADQLPQPPNGHSFYPLAQLRRPPNNDVIEADMITDLRQRRLTAADMEQRLSLLERLLAPAFVSSPLPQFIPQKGRIRQQITLFGTNFNIGAIQVRFDGTPAEIVGAPSATQIAVKVPPILSPNGEAVEVNIAVSNQAGEDISEDTFAIQPEPVFADPRGQFRPNHGAADTQVVLNGFNLNLGTPTVQFLNQTATPPITRNATVVGIPTPTEIVVQVPTDLLPAGSTSADVKITVTTSKGSATSDDTFKVEMAIPAPRFAETGAQFIPQRGIGNQPITLIGEFFNFPPVTVKFEDTLANVTGTPSREQIAVQVPPNMVAAGATKKVRITVRTAGGPVTSGQEFEITGP
jgi:hypothetical protein